MHRTGLLTSALLFTSAVQAQEIGVDEPNSDIVVTGTRSAGRAVLASSAPIDVVSGEMLGASGYADLGRALSNGVQKGPPIGVEEGPPFRII